DHHPAVAGDSGDTADIPFIVDLEAIGVLAVIGPPVITSSVLRSIACQLAVATGPADLHLDQRGSLGLPVDLPHSDASGAAGRHRVILGSNPDDLIDSTSPLRRSVDTEERVTAIVAIPLARRSPPASSPSSLSRRIGGLDGSPTRGVSTSSEFSAPRLACQPEPPPRSRRDCAV
ncbi:MAG: hypothetical protein EBV88_07300, partial [Actinobacteria bacterium]|nr:hypothetical protein [Actinomycetota bacterium]